MRICQKHWEQLRKAISDRGMDHLGAKNGQEAMRAMITDLEGRAAENDFDPLMGAHNMIWSKGLEVRGLALMNNDGPNDGHHCPICVALEQYESWWIEGPANAMQEEAKKLGLIQ